MKKIKKEMKTIIDLLESDEEYKTAEIYISDEEEFYVNFDYIYIRIVFVDMSPEIQPYYRLSIRSNDNNQVSLYARDFESDEIEKIKKFLLENKNSIFAINDKFSEIEDIVDYIE